jgi:hypothetical protein
MELRLESTLGGGVTALVDHVSIFRVDSPATITPTFPFVSDLVVLNPSFEADAYGVSPGYASGNGGSIAGWTFTGAAGVNPYYADPAARTGAQSPFADNAIIEDGQQVAFIQNVGTLSQSIGGFRAGRSYRVTYHENGRFNQGTQWPSLEVRLGGEVVVSPHEVAAMNAVSERTLPYVYVESAPFIAPADGAYTLQFRSLEGNAVSVLLDNVRVVELAEE